MEKRGQIGIEYMIIIGFITFAITMTLVFAYFYSDQIKDRIKMNQIDNFGVQLISSAESVYFSGEPSKSTVRYYLPEGVSSIEIIDDSIVIEISLSSGFNRIAYSSRVPLSGEIPEGEGIKVLVLEAKEDFLLIRKR